MKVTARRKLIILLIAAGLAVGLTWITARYVRHASDIREKAREGEAVLGLRGLVTVHKALYWADGGSTGITLTDSLGRELSFCIDFQMDVPKTGKPSTQGHLFLGATHPTFTGATHVSPGSAEERAIRAVLEEWLDRNVPRRKRKALMDTGVNKLSEEEVQQKRVLGLVQYLKER